MKGDAQVIKHLNTILVNELTAINQYFLHARMYKNWGLLSLGEHEYHESIDEMKHADQLIERVLFLEGENPEEMLQADLDLEMDAHKDLKDAVQYCEECRDYVSRDLFQSILDSEEEHIDWLEEQQDRIKHVGIQNYLQEMMVEKT